MNRVVFEEVQGAETVSPDQYLAIDALTELERHESQAGQLFKLRYFAGCSIEEGGEIIASRGPPPTAIGLSPAPGARGHFWWCGVDAGFS